MNYHELSSSERIRNFYRVMTVLKNRSVDRFLWGPRVSSQRALVRTWTGELATKRSSSWGRFRAGFTSFHIVSHRFTSVVGMKRFPIVSPNTKITKHHQTPSNTIKHLKVLPGFHSFVRRPLDALWSSVVMGGESAPRADLSLCSLAIKQGKEVSRW